MHFFPEKSIGRKVIRTIKQSFPEELPKLLRYYGDEKEFEKGRCFELDSLKFEIVECLSSCRRGNTNLTVYTIKYSSGLTHNVVTITDSAELFDFFLEKAEQHDVHISKEKGQKILFVKFE